MSSDLEQIIRTKELRLVDKDGNDCAVLAAEKGGAFLSFLQNGKEVRARFGVGADGRAMLELGRGEGNSNVILTVEADGRVLVEGFDTEGVQRFKLDMTGNGSHTELSFSEKHRKPRMVLMAEDKGPAGLFIMDQHGKALFSTTP